MKRLVSAVTVGLLGTVALAPLNASAQEVAATAGPKTIGLVLTGWRNAFYETDFGKEECPDGMQPAETKQLEAMPNLALHKATVGGNKSIRGPKGESADNNPLDVVDPLPFREYKSSRGYGVNLDGTQDGRATPKTCQHGKFTSPDGEKVDHQMQRALACVQGYRSGGQMTEYEADEFVTRATNRVLVEIAGVDNEDNDPAVEVTIYKGQDRLVRAAVEGKFVPYTVQRIDDRFDRYMRKTTGKIVNGILLTDPMPEAFLGVSTEGSLGDREMRDLTFRIKLTGNDGEGYAAGYENFNLWFTNHAKKVVSDVGLYSSSGLYKALMRYADGYPNAQGQCEYISRTWKITAVRATIMHRNKPQRVSETDGAIRVARAQQ